MSQCLFVLISLALFAAVLASNPGSLGPEKVKQLSGYVTVPGFANDDSTHIFYWFFEARQNPETAPTVVWLTGGPGCSSLMALFTENGPYQVAQNLSLTVNPYSWNEVANIMWVDNPVSTGFSYSDNPTKDNVHNESQVAEDMYEFLQGFFKAYPGYAKRKFFVFGESYAGHYVPAVGNRIVMGNGNLRPGDITINLGGLGIGNGWVDPSTQYGAYADFLFSKKLISSLERFSYNVAAPLCKDLIATAPSLAFAECNAAEQAILKIAETHIGHSINVYDVRKSCTYPPLCYDFTSITKYLNQPSVVAALGASPTVSWQACNSGVIGNLLGDWVGNFAVDLPAVLAENIPVLVYSGTEDFVCNYLGGEAWTAAFKWPGQNGFNNAPWVSWGNNGGRSKTYQGFTFLEVYNAGHMVPMDQPVIALKMFANFVQG